MDSGLDSMAMPPLPTEVARKKVLVSHIRSATRFLTSVFTALLTNVSWNRCTGGADAKVSRWGGGCKLLVRAGEVALNHEVVVVPNDIALVLCFFKLKG